MKAIGHWGNRVMRIVGLAGLACGTLAGAARATAEEADQVPPVAIRIVESSICNQNGVSLRVEIANLSKAVYRLEVCPSLALSCVRNSIVLVNRDDTGYSLWEPKYDEPSSLDVNLVPGASYHFPITLGFDRIPEDCLIPGRSLSFQLRLQIEKDTWVASEPVELAMPLTDGE